MLFGNKKEKETQRLQELKLEYKGRLGPAQAIDYFKKRFNIILVRDDLTAIFSMGDAIKNSVTSAEIDNLILFYVLDAGQPKKDWPHYDAFMKSGPITLGNTQVHTDGYKKLWKYVAPDDTTEMNKW